METSKNKLSNVFALSTLVLLMMFLVGCSSSDDSGGIASGYSGTGNFNFTGNHTMSFTGTVENTSIIEITDGQSIALSFVDSQGKTFFIGLRGDKIEAKAYTTEDVFTEGYAGIELDGDLYDTGAIGGTGTVSLTKVNKNEISGTVDMTLARPLNTADKVFVTGSFKLNGQ